MSSVTLPTRGLVGMLEDAVLTTADPKLELSHLSAVLLDTAHGDWAFPAEEQDPDADEPLFQHAATDLLVASSTNVAMLAQVHTPCTGRLHKPILMSRMDAAAVIKVFKPLITARLPKPMIHQTVITYTGQTVIVSEDPAQVPGGKSVTMSALDLEEFPRNVADLLEVDPTKPVKVGSRVVPPSYGTGYEGVYFEVLAKVAKRRKMIARVYWYHQSGRVRAEIGGAYTAVMVPVPLPDPVQYDEPQVPVFAPNLPQRAKDTATEPLVPA